MRISDDNFTCGSVWEVRDIVRLDETTSKPKNNAALVDCNFRNVKYVYKCSPQHPLHVNAEVPYALTPRYSKLIGIRRLAKKGATLYRNNCFMTYVMEKCFC